MHYQLVQSIDEIAQINNQPLYDKRLDKVILQ